MTIANETTQPADEGRLEPTVRRPVEEATDAEGPRGTYGCACQDRDARECIRMRYGFVGYSSERCECLCHQWDDDE